VYTGESRATKFRHKSYWKKASDGCSNITDFFSVSHALIPIEHNWAYWQQKQLKAQSPDLQMMSDDEIYNTDNDDLKTDPANEFMIEMGLDLLDFCLEHMETAALGNGNEIGDDLNIDYESLNFNLRLILLTRGSMQLSAA